MKNKFFYYILTLLVTTWSLELSSKSFKESYKYYFGPNLSQNEACLKSLNIAKKNALEKNYEQIDSQTLLQCNQKDNFTCTIPPRRIFFLIIIIIYNNNSIYFI